MLGSIAGYTYQAENYTQESLVELLGQRYRATIIDLESFLDAIANDKGIDRQDEHTFDSDNFPKIIFEDMLECRDRDWAGDLAPEHDFEFNPAWTQPDEPEFICKNCEATL